ncbi:hypothetical protein [Oceanobacillus damuensis]|uniref:hypothetical protein n=1 Tax=Oceanobacillus damuensis TaxID=937928 RepID=UPI00082EF88A|nr:hypothetical protein [Oceanobacillus damuensis]
MKEWSKALEINAPIELVWLFFDGPLENTQQIMPQVVVRKPVKITKKVVGSVYREKYKEGKRIEEYDVETVEYLNKPEYKNLKISFTLADMFEITARYEMKKLNENKTYFKYTTTNHPLRWFARFPLMFASDKVVVEFVERVKHVAEA